MRLSLFLAAASLCACSATALASPVTYTLTGIFSGTLGSTSFTDDPGTITFTGDTSGITSLGAGYYTDVAGASTILLDGIGPATFLSPSFGAESEFDGAGFYDINSGFGVSIYDPALGAYALTAPFQDTAYLQESFGASFGTTEATSLGDLSITGDSGTSATFAASQVATTPEPSSFLLLGTGLVTALGVLKRRYV